jgi:hypothetical protein
VHLSARRLHLEGAAITWHNKEKEKTGAARIALRSWPDYKREIRRNCDPVMDFAVALNNIRQCLKRDDEDYNAHLQRFLLCEQDLEIGTVSYQQQCFIYLDTLSPVVAHWLRTTNSKELQHMGMRSMTANFQPSTTSYDGEVGLALGDLCIQADTYEKSLKEMTSATTASVTTQPTQSGSGYRGLRPWRQPAISAVSAGQAPVLPVQIVPPVTQVQIPATAGSNDVTTTPPVRDIST